MPKGFDKRELLLYAAGSLVLILALVYFFVPEQKAKASCNLLHVPRSQAEDFNTPKTAAYKRKQSPATVPQKPVKLNLNFSNRSQKQQNTSTTSTPPAPAPKPSNKKPVQSIPASEKSKNRVNTGFYSWSNQPQDKSQNHVYTLATIDNDQLVQQGAKVRIRLLESTVIQGVEVPRNTLLIGIIERHRDRIDIIINHIKVKEKHIETSLLAYDEQYNRGIFISTEHDPSLKDELESELVEEATRAIPLNRVASMAGKLFSRKTRKGEKIVLPDGFRIYLKKATSDETSD